MVIRFAVRNRDGWTLIELTVVIALMTVLASIALSGYRIAITRSREAVLKEDLFRIRDAIDQYYSDREEYPKHLYDLVSYGYLRAVPLDPFTESTESWRTVLSEMDATDFRSSGIYDIMSGSTGTAIDGSAYADW